MGGRRAGMYLARLGPLSVPTGHHSQPNFAQIVTETSALLRPLVPWFSQLRVLSLWARLIPSHVLAFHQTHFYNAVKDPPLLSFAL